MTDRIEVFVYGTLKPGERYYDIYCRDRILTAQEAIAYGQLYALPMGYPAMTPGKDAVHGFLLSFSDPEILKDLDDYEGYIPEPGDTPNEYDRVWIEVFDSDRAFLGYAWTYQMTVAQAQAWGGILLPAGLWVSQKF